MQVLLFVKLGFKSWFKLAYLLITWLSCPLSTKVSDCSHQASITYISLFVLCLTPPPPQVNSSSCCPVLLDLKHITG